VPDSAGITKAGAAPLYQTLALLRMHAPTRGEVRTTVVFAYGAAPHNVKQVTRMLDKSNLVNDARVLGKGKAVAPSTQVFRVPVTMRNTAGVHGRLGCSRRIRIVALSVLSHDSDACIESD
jgi:hypothetical protein